MSEHDPDQGAGPRILKIPEGEDRERLVCPDCGYIAYDNPKIVLGSVALWQSKILLCRRAIPPRVGFWTLPAGFMEHGETLEEGAKREAWEEAGARMEMEAMLAVFSLPRIGQVQIFYRAHLKDADVKAGPESQEVALFRWDEIPWEELAFPTVRFALEAYAQSKDKEIFAPYELPRDADLSLPSKSAL